MFTALQPLYVIALGFALMLGFLSPSDVMRKLARMVLLAMLFPFGISLARHVWAGLSPGAQLLALVAGPPLALFALMSSTRFGRNTLAQFLGSLMHTVVIGAVRLAFRLAIAPFRLLGWLVRALRR